jgi:hypothetical protein
MSSRCTSGGEGERTDMWSIVEQLFALFLSTIHTTDLVVQGGRRKTERERERSYGVSF